MEAAVTFLTTGFTLLGNAVNWCLDGTHVIVLFGAFGGIAASLIYRAKSVMH